MKERFRSFKKSDIKINWDFILVLFLFAIVLSWCIL